MKVKRDSWHYRWLAYNTCMSRYLLDKMYIDNGRAKGYSWIQIYEKMGNISCKPVWQAPTTFCAYWRNVLLYPFITITINISLLLGLIYLVFNSGAIIAGAFAFVLVVLAAGALLLGIISGAAYTLERLDNKLEDKSSFIGNIYNSYKNRVCTIMEYESEK